jgi:hypothetical protein
LETITAAAAPSPKSTLDTRFVREESSEHSVSEQSSDAPVIHLSREEWGIVTDALMEHQDAESDNYERREMCTDLLTKIGQAHAVLPSEPARQYRA